MTTIDFITQLFSEVDDKLTQQQEKPQTCSSETVSF